MLRLLLILLVVSDTANSRPLIASATAQTVVTNVYGHQSVLLECPADSIGRWMAVVGGWPWSPDTPSTFDVGNTSATSTASDDGGSSGSVWARDQFLWSVDEWRWVDGREWAAGGSTPTEWSNLFTSVPQPVELLSAVHHRQHHTLTPYVTGGSELLEVFVLLGGYKNGQYLADAFVLIVNCHADAERVMDWHSTVTTSADAECAFNGFVCSSSQSAMPGRAGHAAAAVTIDNSNTILISGGTGVMTGAVEAVYFADMWLLEVDGDESSTDFGLRWSKLEATLPDNLGRVFHSATPHDTSVIILGGQMGEMQADVNTVWWLSVQDMSWTDYLSTPPPSTSDSWCIGGGIWGHQATQISQRDLAVANILPAVSESGSSLTTSQEWLLVTGGFCAASGDAAGSFNGNQFVYNLLDHSWSIIDGGGINRIYASSVALPSEDGYDAIIIYGGDSASEGNTDPATEVQGQQDSDLKLILLNPIISQQQSVLPVLVANGNQFYPTLLQPEIVPAAITSLNARQQSANVTQINVTGYGLLNDNVDDVFDIFVTDALNLQLSRDCILFAGASSQSLQCVTTLLPAGYYTVRIQRSFAQDDGTWGTEMWASAVGYACLALGYVDTEVAFGSDSQSAECVETISQWKVAQLSSTGVLTLQLYSNSSTPAVHDIAVELKADDGSAQNCLWLSRKSTSVSCQLPGAYSPTQEPSTWKVDVIDKLSGLRWIDNAPWTANETVQPLPGSPNSIIIGGRVNMDWLQLSTSGNSTAMLMTGAGFNWNSSAWLYVVKINSVDCELVSQSATAYFCSTPSIATQIGKPLQVSFSVTSQDGQPFVTYLMDGVVCTSGVTYAVNLTESGNTPADKSATLTPQVLDFNADCVPPVIPSSSSVYTLLSPSTIARSTMTLVTAGTTKSISTGYKSIYPSSSFRYQPTTTIATMPPTSTMDSGITNNYGQYDSDSSERARQKTIAISLVVLIVAGFIGVAAYGYKRRNRLSAKERALANSV